MDKQNLLLSSAIQIANQIGLPLLNFNVSSWRAAPAGLNNRQVDRTSLYDLHWQRTMFVRFECRLVQFTMNMRKRRQANAMGSCNVVEAVHL